VRVQRALADVGGQLLWTRSVSMHVLDAWVDTKITAQKVCAACAAVRAQHVTHAGDVGSIRARGRAESRELHGRDDVDGAHGGAQASG
jgi:hypothetical protein